jgi:hypothetical protein
MRLGLALAALGLALVALCCVVAPPRQREDWSISPIQYGATRYAGLHAPRAAKPRRAGDAGVP